MKIGSWNEKDNPDLPAWQVRADAREVKRRFRGASIIGAQEIGERADHRAIRRAFGLRWETWPHDQATPLIWNNLRFQLIARDWVKAHGGVAHVTPHRGFTWGLFQRRRSSLAPFYVVNTHLVSRPTATRERAAMWDTHVEKLRAFVAERHEQGRDIFVVGDFNKKLPPKLHDRQRVLRSHWLDHVLLIPGSEGNDVTVVDAFVMRGPLFTDHKPVGVVLEMGPR